MSDNQHRAIGENELLPCPFCGRSDLVLHEDYSEDEPSRAYAWHVFCRDCHCHGANNFPIGWAETKSAAIAAWNRRKDGLGTVSVKALAWEDRDDTETYGGDGAFGSNAKTPFSDYWTYWNGKQEKPWALMLGRNHLGWFDIEDQAKSAAQSDFETRVKSCLTSIGVEAGRPWFPPNVSERLDGFECLAWHRGRWRHVRWSDNSKMWMFGYGSAGFNDLGRLFAPLPWNTPEVDFWEGEPS